MKKNNLFLILLLCMLIMACIPEPAVSVLKFEFINNSQDTIGCSVYVHKKRTENNDVYYIISGHDIAPMCSSIIFAQHNGYDDSWSSFFKDEGIDTLYIYIAKEVPKANGQKCKLPDSNNILKIYKYYEKNTDLAHMVSPSITYP